MVTGPHRPHHQAVAKSVDLKRMAAEIFDKSTGLSGGRGGHNDSTASFRKFRRTIHGGRYSNKFYSSRKPQCSIA